MQSALSGFSWVNIFRLFHPETLHQDHQGVGRRLVNKLQKLVTAAEFARINKHLLQTEPFPGQTIHSKGFLGSGITGHVANCMLQRLSAAVLTLAHRGSLPEALRHWLTALTSTQWWQPSNAPCLMLACLHRC